MRAGRATPVLSAVFLDRDGVINEKAAEGSYVTSWDEFAFLPGALHALARLARGRAFVVVVTNQRGIARGVMTEAALVDIHRRMRAAVEATGGRLDAILHCPHEVGTCDCRKPAGGMFRDAAARLGFELDRAAMIGDSASDIEAARRLEIPAIRIAPDPVRPAVVGGEVARVPDLGAAVDWLQRAGMLPAGAGPG